MSRDYDFNQKFEKVQSKKGKYVAMALLVEYLLNLQLQQVPGEDMCFVDVSGRHHSNDVKDFKLTGATKKEFETVILSKFGEDGVYSLLSLIRVALKEIDEYEYSLDAMFALNRLIKKLEGTEEEQ